MYYQYETDKLVTSELQALKCIINTKLINWLPLCRKF